MGNDTSFVSRLVDRINSLDPDLIVFTGDVVNRETSEMEPFLSVLSRLKARDGVYSVLGKPRLRRLYGLVFPLGT